MSQIFSVYDFCMVCVFLHCDQSKVLQNWRRRPGRPSRRPGQKSASVEYQWIINLWCTAYRSPVSYLAKCEPRVILIRLGGEENPKKPCIKPSVILVSLIPWKFKLKLGILAPTYGKEDLVFGITALIPEQGILCLALGQGQPRAIPYQLCSRLLPLLFCSFGSSTSVLYRWVHSWLLVVGQLPASQPGYFLSGPHVCCSLRAEVSPLAAAAPSQLPPLLCRGLAQVPQGGWNLSGAATDELVPGVCSCSGSCILPWLTVLTLKLKKQCKGSSIARLAHGWVVENHRGGCSRRGEREGCSVVLLGSGESLDLDQPEL